MPPRVPGYTLAEVLRAFHTDGWTINEGSKHTQARKGNRMVPIPRHRGRCQWRRQCVPLWRSKTVPRG